MRCAADLVEKRRVEWAEPDSGGSLSSAAEALEQAQKELLSRVGKLDSKAWARKAALTMGGKVAWSAPLGEMLWSFLFDAIHHRGQLSTYLRPAGGKVPSIYGPSADDAGA
jgi:uncharacterized damage-inducible protein DinB